MLIARRRAPSIVSRSVMGIAGPMSPASIGVIRAFRKRSSTAAIARTAACAACRWRIAGGAAKTPERTRDGDRHPDPSPCCRRAPVGTRTRPAFNRPSYRTVRALRSSQRRARIMLQSACDTAHDNGAASGTHSPYILFALGDARRAGTGHPGTRGTSRSHDDAAVHAPQPRSARQCDSAARLPWSSPWFWRHVGDGILRNRELAFARMI
jgi:hypothetical protein